MRWYAEMTMRLPGALLDDDRFTALADALCQIEEKDPAVADADVGASLAEGWVTASMVAEADDLEAAVRKTIAVVRAAIRAAGDGAPGWEKIAELPALSVRPAGDGEPAEPVAV